MRTKSKSKYTVEIFNKWLEENNANIRYAMENNEKQINIYNDFLNWMDRKKYKVISTTSFFTLFRQVRFTSNKNNGNGNGNIPHNNHMSAKDQFAMLERFVGLIHRNLAIKSLIVHGAPGTGKSTVVIETLKKLNKKSHKDFVVYSGGVKGTYELAKILYENRNNKVIVMDDFDSAFRTKNEVNLLKTALQDDGDFKHISYIDTTKKSKKDKIPASFDFNSRIIFITNKLRIDPAIKSRSKIVHIDLTNEEMLERIKDMLPNFIPRASMELKMEVYEFLKKNLNKINTLDFRKFKFALANYLIDKDEGDVSGRWKRWTLNELNS